MAALTPTEEQYRALAQAASYMIQALIDDPLPPVLITFDRSIRAVGYCVASAWGGSGNLATELCLNPEHLQRPADVVLSTLVHELVHAWQNVHGTPGRRGYHNMEWAVKMVEVGLQPHSTTNPAKMTGERCSHSIIAGGKFITAASALIEAGWLLPYVAHKRPKAQGKTTYRCGPCGARVWGAPGLALICGVCQAPMMAHV